MNSIPTTLKPLVRRLEQACPDLSHEDLLSIILVIRVADILHQSFCGTFLTLSLTSKLCNHLDIPELELELEVFVLRWSFREGTVAVAHRITFDYDMSSCYQMTKIARAVLQDQITPKQALQQVQRHCSKQDYSRIELLYESFPSRSLVIPLMAATCATVFFDGTWFDFGFATVCGLVAGLVASICTHYSKELTGVMDYVVAILVAMVAIASVVAFPNESCFISQVLGTLYWFFYGTAFVLSVYEVTNNQLMTGISRFCQATLRTFGLAFGAMIGVWFSSWYLNEQQAMALVAPCSDKSSQISDLWFILLFPLAGIACLAQFRVNLVHFPMCLVVQIIAYGSQYVLGTVWKQPDFVSNIVPAFLATISSSAATILMRQYYKWKNMAVDSFGKGGIVDENEKCNDGIHRDESIDPTERCSPQVDDLLQVTEEGDSSAYSPAPQVDENGQLPEMSRGDLPRRRRHTTPTPQPDSSSPELENSDTIGFVNDGVDASAIRRNDDLTFTRSDTWFCLLPALYLLVPGAKIFQSAFGELLRAVASEQHDIDVDDFADLGASLMVIAIGQVVGLRFGFLTVWLVNEANKRIRNRWG